MLCVRVCVCVGVGVWGGGGEALASDNAATAPIQAEKGRHGSCGVGRERAGRKRENLESNGQKALFNLVSVEDRCQSGSVRSTNQPEAEKMIALSSPLTPSQLSLPLPPPYTVPTFLSQICWL